MHAITCTVSDRVTAYDVYTTDTVYVGCAVSLHLGCLPSRRGGTDPAAWLWRWIRERAIYGDEIEVYTRALTLDTLVSERVPAALIVRVDNHTRGTGWCATCSEVTVRAGRTCVACHKTEAA